jgi:VanZ family protein
MKTKFHLGYGLAAIGYMTGIFVLSSAPGESALSSPLFWNLLHVPLFAGLASCLLLSLTEGQWDRSLSWQLYVVIGLLAGVYAAVDEWHQSFVSGRYASAVDFLLNCVGIVALLLIHRLVCNHRVTS